MFIVDGITEQPNITDREKDFLGTPYAFGTIWNFGGHQNFGAASPSGTRSSTRGAPSPAPRWTASR